MDVCSHPSPVEINSKIRIIIADRYPMPRLGLRITIEKQQDLEVVAEAVDLSELLETITHLHPDIVIVDEQLIGPGIDITRLMEKMKDKTHNTKMLILTNFRDIQHLNQLISEGTSYLKKTAIADEVVYFIRSMITGINPYVRKKLYNDNSIVKLNESKKLILMNSNEITPKELEILKSIYNGKTNKEIASIMGNNVPTTKAHINTLFTKLGVSSRTEAVSLCLKSGILTLRDLNEQSF